MAADENGSNENGSSGSAENQPAGSDSATVPDSGPADTAPTPPADPWAGETELRPPLPDATRADIPPADRGPGGTGVLPTVPADSPPEPRWSARAQVRTPDLGAQPDEEQWAYPGRSPWVPVLVAVGILILVGLIVLGAILLLNAKNSPGVVTPSASAVTTTQPSSPALTTTARTSAPPSTSAPVEVAIPEVKGLTYEQAAAKLQAAGFIPNRVDEISAEQPAGKVVGTDPGVGSKVLTGTKINVIVSKGVPTSSPSTTAAHTPTPSHS